MMEDLLEVVLQLRIMMRAGLSAIAAMDALTFSANSETQQVLRSWLVKGEATGEFAAEGFSDPHLRTFLSIIESGIRGAPIDPRLAEFESELLTNAELDYEKKLQILPFKLLAPLMICIFPSVLILIVGPLLFIMSEGL